MRVLGVDPGLTRCGVGVVDGGPGRLVLVEVTVIRTPAGDDIATRLLAVADRVEAALDTPPPRRRRRSSGSSASTTCAR